MRARLALGLLFLGSISLGLNTVNAQEVELLGSNLEYHKSFTIDKTIKYNSENLPKNAIGLYGNYAVYEADGSSSSQVLAFMRKKDSVVGALVLNTIDFKCKNQNPNCYPLTSLDEKIEHYELNEGFHRVIVPNIETWLEVYKILQASKEVKKFAPSFDLGSQATGQ